MKRNIKKALSVAACSAAAFAPFAPNMCIASATEASQVEKAGVVEVEVKYDSDIQPAEGDSFVVTYCMEENPADTATIQIDASKFTKEKGSLNMPVARYLITGIRYEGKNPDIISQGYGVNNNFVSDLDMNGSFIIAIGDSATKSLEADYGPGMVCIMNSERDENGNVKTRDDRATPAPTSEGTENELGGTGEGAAQATSAPAGEGAAQPSPDPAEQGTGTDEGQEGVAPDIMEAVQPSSVPAEQGTSEAQEGASPDIITDTGEAKIERYDYDKDKKKETGIGKQKSEEDNKKGALTKLVGLLAFALVGFAIIFGLHAKGKF